MFLPTPDWVRLALLTRSTWSSAMASLAGVEPGTGHCAGKRSEFKEGLVPPPSREWRGLRGIRSAGEQPAVTARN